MQPTGGYWICSAAERVPTCAAARLLTHWNGRKSGQLQVSQMRRRQQSAVVAERTHHRGDGSLQLAGRFVEAQRSAHFDLRFGSESTAK